MELRLGIVAEVVDQVAPAHVHHRADRNERAEAHHFLEAPVQHRGAQRAALADEAHRAGPRDGGGEGGVQAGERAHHAQAVGADDADAGGPRLFQQLALERRAFRRRFP